jgi:hypothetical protein
MSQRPFDIDDLDSSALREALRGRTGNTGVTGYEAPPKVTYPEHDRPPVGPVDAPASNGRSAADASDPRSFIANTLSGATYGLQGLESKRKDFEDAGYKLQFGDGFTRGRVYDPTGRMWDVFDPIEGRTVEDNWSTNPRGSKWDVRDMGMPGTGGGAPAPYGGASMSPFDPLRQSMMPTDESTYKRLVERLQQISGGGMENDALRSLF